MIRQGRKSGSEAARLDNPQELIALIEAGRRAAADFHHEEAISCFEDALASPLLNEEQRATVRCSLAESLENLARYREAIEVMADYENQSVRNGLHPVVLFQVWLRMGSAYGYAGDHPRAISYLKQALALAEERQDAEDLGACHLVLGRIYRAIGETEFARDHLKTALQHHRALGQWQALAQTYFLLGNVCVGEGDFNAGREHFEQAIKIIGDRRAPLLLGSIYTNLSNLILWREHGQASEGIEVIEKAIFFLKQARNERILAYAYSNLGYGLGHIGDWSRAEQALHQAIELGRRSNDLAVQGTALDTLGEITMLRGDFAEAEQMLRQAVTNAQAANFPFGEEQALQTLGRCLLMRGEKARAIEIFEQELNVATKLKDKRLAASARLHLAEACLEAGDERQAHRLLDAAAEAIEPSDIISLVAHFRLLSGLMRARAGGFEAARHHLSQAITIYEMISDPYEEAAARYHLGFISIVYGRTADRSRAGTELQKARAICERLGAAPLLSRIDDALAALARTTEDESVLTLPAAPAPVVAPAPEVTGAEVLRLIGASSSRELLLHELVTLIYESAGRVPVAAFVEDEAGKFLPVAVTGLESTEAASIAERLAEKLVLTHTGPDPDFDDATLHRLRTNGQPRTILYIGSPNVRELFHAAIEPLIRLAEICLELGALREQTRGLLGYEANELKHESQLPGLVLASQPMQKLADDIHKIRGSRVTALITGESGTGKELVARAIHKLSDRRDAPFVPFNCTVAPREIIASQLFGHRKGAFTGAVSDYQGVIRSADGGTLFLDEVGDLALEVQPQLLRFLQEGEIQPLGETRPVRVDVRVVAATNANIEKLVAEGKFREDLYYRLNVIRLHIPPLRDRREEIPVLIDHFLNLYANEAGKRAREGRNTITIAPQALDLLMVYDWPGNVRQLANEIQRLVAYTPAGGTITERDLSPQIFSSGEQARTSSFGSRNLAAVTNALLHRVQAREEITQPPGERTISLNFRPGEQTLEDVFTEIERQLIADAMRRHKGRREQVARELGITRKGLYLKLQRLKMDEQSESAGRKSSDEE
ncbi:MAG TPA: sigma 54-interacting transcriptional regulator [Blastocatellia bacterium]|nr:sigma 54-interacting transcriptional regulator [Blastocatellia bacterium]